MSSYVNSKFLEQLLRARGDPNEDTDKDKEKHQTENDKTFFEDIFTETALTNLRKWFADHATTRTNQLDENQFVAFMRNLTCFPDYRILEILDIFDINDSGAINWDDFFILVALFAALESKKCTQFFYKWKNKIFELLAHQGANTINFERFSRFGYVIGIPEEHMLLTLQELEIEKSRLNSINFEDFQLYYFAILEKLDKGAPNLVGIKDPARGECCLIL